MKSIFNRITTTLVALAVAIAFSVPAFAGDGVFNVAKGAGNEYFDRVANNDPANSGIVIILLKAAEADAVLEDYDDVGALLAAGGNTEADFTNYTRIVYTDSDITGSTVDDTNNRKYSDMPDPSYTSAGGTLDNTIVKMLYTYDNDTTGGTDSDLIPIAHVDFATTTNGNNLTAILPSTGAFVAN